jgi:hypothetical protein
VLCFFTNSAPLLNCDQISTLKDLRACAGKIDLRFHEPGKTRANSGDLAGFGGRTAPKFGTGL